MSKYKPITAVFFSEYIAKLRARLGLSQEKMAEKLRITARAYRDLECGKSCCSGTTLMFTLLLIEDYNISGLLDDFRNRVSDFEENDIA